MKIKHSCLACSDSQKERCFKRGLYKDCGYYNLSETKILKEASKKAYKRILKVVRERISKKFNIPWLIVGKVEKGNLKQ